MTGKIKIDVDSANANTIQVCSETTLYGLFLVFRSYVVQMQKSKDYYTTFMAFDLQTILQDKYFRYVKNLFLFYVMNKLYGV